MTDTLLKAISAVNYPKNGLPVEKTAATTFCEQFGLKEPNATENQTTGVNIFVSGFNWKPETSISEDKGWMWVKISEAGNGEIVASKPSLLYAVVKLLINGLTEEQKNNIESGLLLTATFDWVRPLYDQVLTQNARTVRDFDRESYISYLAMSGHTHLEVNGLSTHIPFEPGVPHEYYNQFYTYCAGLSQFVDSPLTRGLYPHEYLQANLNNLKELANLGRKYGLLPGIVCFEPRTLPELFFQKYPTLRGARVDHPFRSYVPRYTLAQDHPVTQDHYSYQIKSLLKAVPDLSYMSIWTNDSGAGFEHTASLYVGRNGGPYLIREWRNHDKIAEAAGNSAIRYLQLLRDAAAEINPDFEVILRLEPFKVEHDYIMKGMGKGVTFEGPSLMVRGYHLPYSHPKYPEQQSAAGSIFHTDMVEEEKEVLSKVRKQDVEPSVHVAASSAFNIESLLGLPFPKMVHKKLTSINQTDISRVNIFGGLLHMDKTPYWPNFEVIRMVQLNNNLTIDEILEDIASRWAGDEATALRDLWEQFEEAISYLPILPLYSHFGFVWLRTWVRPLTPNLEIVPKEDRLYFERFLVSTPNNPSINDLGKDVLFDLIPLEAGKKMLQQFDENVLPRLTQALETVDAVLSKTGADVFSDLKDRLRIFKCWATTQRNTCAWVVGVHGYLEAEDESTKSACKNLIQCMIDLDLENTHELLDLWENSPRELFLVSKVGETSFVWGENFGDQLKKKIELTNKYRHCEPYIDKDILWRLV